MKSHFRYAAALGAASLVVALSGCAGEPAATPDSSDAPLMQITIATGVDASYAPIFVADSEGIFEAHGLDATIVQTEGGPAPTQTVVAGEADIAMQTDLTSVSLMGSNPDLVGLGVLNQSETNFFVVFGPNITDSSQIKKLAIVPGSAAFMTAKYLESEDIDIDDVELIQVPPADIPAVMGRGDVDASVIFQPWADRVVAEAGGEIKGDIGDFGAYYTQWVVSTSAWVDGNVDAAAAVFAAIEEANAFIVDDPDAAADIVTNTSGVPVEQALAVFKGIDFTVRDFSEADLAQARDAGAFFVSQGSIESEPDYDAQILIGWFDEHVGKK